MMTAKSVVFDFFNKGTLIQREQVYYCKIRDEATARLHRWLKEFKSFGINDNNAAILLAIVGELTNNSFDHNLGQWQGLPGCLVGFEACDTILEIFIADRGQGIIASLKKAGLENYPPSDVLRKAFTERISGRSPERRGNGLKFVAKHVLAARASLLCLSNKETFVIGQDNKVPNPSEISNANGTFLEIHWRIS